MTQSRERGFALLYILLLSVIIVMVLSALLTISMGQIRQTRHGIDHTRALFAAESGLAAVMSELERDPAWTNGFSNISMPENSGTYSAEFAGAGPATAGQCVNNLLSDVAADSYHGTNTVLPRSALLVVTGRSGTSSKTIEAHVVFGGYAPDRVALVASGTIALNGDARVNGLESIMKLSEVPAIIHSNDESEGVKITYAPRASGESLEVEETVSSSSSSPAATAINLAPPTTATVRESRVPPKRLPEVNIEALLQDHSSSPGPPISAAPTVLTLTGNNYYAGNVTVNGDVILDGNARLLVDGNLTINGSVKGNGALIVGGTTKFYGAADVTADPKDYVSVLSRGHVVMSGFQGETYMQSLAASDPDAAKRWADAKWAIRQIQNYLAEHAHLDPTRLSERMRADDSQLDTWMSVLAYHDHHDEVAAIGRTFNAADYFQGRFAGASPLTSEAFLHERFQHIDDLFRVGFRNRDGVPVVTNEFRVNDHLIDNYEEYDPAVDGGLFDSFQSWGWNLSLFPNRVRVLQEIIHIINRYDIDSLGSAEFKGYIYTSGALVVKDDLNLLGAVVVNGRESVGTVTVDGITYKPGDVGLQGHIRLTHVQEMIQGGVQNLSGVGKLDVKRWVSR